MLYLDKHFAIRSLFPIIGMAFWFSNTLSWKDIIDVVLLLTSTFAKGKNYDERVKEEIKEKYT